MKKNLKQKLKSELISVRTSSNLDYIACVCQNCNIIGMLREFHNKYFCSRLCQKKYSMKRRGADEQLKKEK